MRMRTREKRNRRKAFWLAVITVLMLGVLSGCGDSSGKKEKKSEDEEEEEIADEPYALRDPLVERCIREALNKKPGEEVSREECESITKLVIFSAWDMGLDEDIMKLDVEPGNYVDLSDLKYLTGLKELEIIPFINHDLFVGLDAVTACKELEKLSFIAGQDYVERNFGYKYFANIVRELPKLTTLDLGYEIPKDYQTYVAGTNQSLSFVFEKNPDNSYVYWISESINLDGLDQLPDDAEDVVIRFSGNEILDFSVFSRFRHLKTLTLWGNVPFDPTHDQSDVAYDKGGMFEIRNAEALKDKQELFSLNISGAFGDFSGIGELSQLKELSILRCIMEEPEFLSGLPNLRELTFRYNYSSDFPKYVTKDNLPKLVFLRADNAEFESLDSVAKIKTLKMLCLEYTPYYVKPADEDVTNRIFVKEVAKCGGLRYLILCLDDEQSLKPLENLKKLEYVHISGRERLTGKKYLLESPNLYAVICPNTKDYVEDCVKLIKEASKKEKLSTFIGCKYDSDVIVTYSIRDMGYVLEMQEGFEACREAHVFCEGDVLLQNFNVDTYEEVIEELDKLYEQYYGE